MCATLSAIHTFPLKSGAPLSLTQAPVQSRGLMHDRRWMVIDSAGKFVTGRQLSRLTLIRAQSDEHGLRVDAPGMPMLQISAPTHGVRVKTAVWGAAVTPLLAGDDAHAWISEFLGAPHRLVYMDDACARPLKLKYDGIYGLDSDEVSFADGFPLLLTSQASLDLLNSKLAQPVPMLRFRPNLVVAGTTAHAEDEWKRIRIGECEFEVAKPCTRCVFTTVDFERGERDANGEPLRTLITYRRTPEGVSFGQNLIPRKLGSVQVGDRVEVLS